MSDPKALAAWMLRRVVQEMRAVADEYERPTTTVLPTERLQAIIDAYHRHAEALIAIAANLHYYKAFGWTSCGSCRMWVTTGCPSDCPGLLARRALGVA
jgi:hypothetical protein